MKVLFVSSEIAPLAKSGGLADVAGSLPPALAARGAQVVMAMPLYGVVDRQAHNLEHAGLSYEVWACGGWGRRIDVWRARLGGCDCYLLEHNDLFDRPDLYGPPGGAYGDNLLRFVVFNKAVIELCRALNFAPDIVHANDWQTALLPAYIKSRPFDLGPIWSAATVLTVHNMAYQGVYGREMFGQTELPADMDSVGGAEYWGNISLLKAGLVRADAITTVSPSYAWEIQTPEGGHGMDGVLHARRDVLRGILNGADYDQWSPEKDRYLPANYSAQDLAGKLVCRDKLLEAFGLEPAGERTAVIGFLGRLTHQKGVDFIAEMAWRLMEQDVRLCLFGTGDQHLEGMLWRLGQEHAGRIGVRLAFQEDLAHLLTAGCDILLMPSRYEPCGLSQLYAMRYGTAPLVRATGGLKDTVEPFEPDGHGSGVGFVFHDADAHSLWSAVRHALWVFGQPDQWRILQQNAMARDFSWNQSARQYLELYEQTMARRGR